MNLEDILGFINELEGLELPPNRGPDIIDIVECATESLQLQKFRVVRILEPRLDWNSVVNLVPKGVGGVINEDSLG